MTLGKLLHLSWALFTRLLNGGMMNLSCLTFKPGKNNKTH